MTLQEKIHKKAKAYSELAPTFLQGAEFALENQWISVEDDLPCNHSELVRGTEISEGTETIDVFVANLCGCIWSDYMVYENGKWRWNDFEQTYWMITPKLHKEQEFKL